MYSKSPIIKKTEPLNDIRQSEFHDINDTIEIKFQVPEILSNLMIEAELADKLNDGSYDNLADTIDVVCKNYCSDGKITKKQWDIIIERYPQ